MGAASKKEDDQKCNFCPAERKAIEVHRYRLSEKYNRYVSIEEAIRSWLRDYSQMWREKQMKKSVRAQLKEICKHKWIQSEKAGCNLGKAAVEDWIKEYAQIWRQRWEEKENSP